MKRYIQLEPVFSSYFSDVPVYSKVLAYARCLQNQIVDGVRTGISCSHSLSWQDMY